MPSNKYLLEPRSHQWQQKLILPYWWSLNQSNPLFTHWVRHIILTKCLLSPFTMCAIDNNSTWSFIVLAKAFAHSCKDLWLPFAAFSWVALEIHIEASSSSHLLFRAWSSFATSSFVVFTLSSKFATSLFYCLSFLLCVF